MARLRQKAQPASDSHRKSTDGTANTQRPTRPKAPRRHVSSGSSSAEDLDLKPKMAKKHPVEGWPKNTQIRLQGRQALSSLASKQPLDLLGPGPRRQRVKHDARPANQELNLPLKVLPAWELDACNESPIPDDSVDEVDAEESVWCGDVGGSESPSEDDLPDAKTFVRPLFDSKAEINATSGSSLKLDLATQMEELRLFDNHKDPFRSKAFKQPVTQLTELSRPGSSSDKENADAIIRFSPPRSKNPQKKDLLERPSTPTIPPSPAKSKLKSPSKKPPQIPTPPLRSSLDAFWSAENINQWNDQYSPQKPLESPRKNRLLLDLNDATPITPHKSQSPTKRNKAEIQAKKDFSARKMPMAESFLHELDQTITKNEIATLTTKTGGVQLIWSKSLNSTAGRANWRCETTKSRPQGSSGPVEITHKHFASIELAEKVINNEHRLLNVLAHEFCHLANFMISGIKDQPHGKQFKAWGAKVTKAFGGRGVEVTTKHTYEIEYKYEWRCAREDCGLEFKRHSKSIDPKKHRCGGCRGDLVQVKPVPRQAKGAATTAGSGTNAHPGGPTGYAAFVKEHFAALKKGMPGVSHKEVMEALSRKYRAEKAGGAAELQPAVDIMVKSLETLAVNDNQKVVIELN